MPRKRKSAASKSELGVGKKFTIYEHGETLIPHCLGSSRMSQNPHLSHAHPDMPLASTEPSSNYIPSSSPIERHMRRRSTISQDLQRVNFPRDADGFIAQVQDAVPGKDISPYAAHIRSGSSPVPYNSRDYGPRAASTPSEGVGEVPEMSGQIFDPSDDRQGSGQEAVYQFGDSNEPSNDLPEMDDEEKDGQESFHEPSHDALQKNEEQTSSNIRTLPEHSFVGFSGIPWDLENSGPRRMLGRRPPLLPPPRSESTSLSPGILPQCQSNDRKQDHSKDSILKEPSARPSTMLRGGLLETKDDTIVELPPVGISDLRRGLPPLIANFVSLRTFISSRGNEYFCEIDEDYLTDRFNLTGLNTDVQYYQYALDLVTDVFDLDCDDDMREQIEKSARHLYGLVHARYITTTRGLAKMVGTIEVPAITEYRMANAVQLEKYKKCDFGKCPRVMCQNHPLLPTGMADLPHVQSVKLYCGKCEDLYNPKSSRHSTIDGAYFGTSFQNILFQVYPALIPERSVRRYEPRVFGFKVHAAATLERWQTKKREEMQERLREVGVERVFKEDMADSGEEMEEDDGEDGDGFVE